MLSIPTRIFAVPCSLPQIPLVVPMAVVKFAAHLPCAVRTITAQRLISPRKANDFNARWVSDAIFLSHPDGACGCKCRATPMLHPCLLKRVSLLVYIRVCTQRNFQFDYITPSLPGLSRTVHRGFLLDACYIHSCSQTTVSGWNKAFSFDATPIFPRRPMEHNKRSPTIAFVVISSRPRLYHFR